MGESNSQATVLPPTEQRHPLSRAFDDMPTLAMVRLMNQMDATIPLAVAEALPMIAACVDQIVATIEQGGRLFYQGAGTSGRLAVLDAAELLPTFGVPVGVVIGLIAGGDRAMLHSVEGAEDSREQGKGDLVAHAFNDKDMLIGVAASGRTPYVLGGLAYATHIGAVTGCVVCNPGSAIADAAQLPIEVITGPEVLTGSTRLRAGTATKVVLNMLSTCAMAKLGKVYGNLMVDVQPTNAKLRQRAVRIVCEITGVSTAEAEVLLTQANWQVKRAVVMGLAGIDADQATARLAASRGRIRQAIDLTQTA